MTLQKIKSLLGEPYYEVENFILYNGDCMNLMCHLPQHLLNLTVTSPPYNIGKEYEKITPLDDYLDWCEKWIKQIHRITAKDGTFWLNLGYLSITDQAKAIPIPYLLWDRIPFYLIQEIIWHYTAGVAGKKFYSPRNEKFLWYVKDQDDYIFNLDDVRDPNVKYPNQKKNGKIKVNPLGKNPGDVWKIPKVTSGRKRSSKERTPHPAQFPESVITRIIKASSNKGNIVFDPFIGSGTVAIVALQLGRSAVGIEINVDYCDIIVNRVEKYLERSKLPTQQSLFD